MVHMVIVGHKTQQCSTQHSTRSFTGRRDD